MNYTFELNNERKDSMYVSGKVTAKSPVVEIFSAMVAGKDLDKFGKKGNEAVKFVKELNERASNGDPNAISELNELRRFAIEPELLKEMKLLNVFGNYRALGYNDSCEVEVTDFAGVDAKIQAMGQDVTFPVARKKRVPIPTVTISAGYAVDYRKAMMGDMSDENALQNQIRTDLRNKANKHVVETVYNSIKDASGVKYFFEGAGLTKTGVDDVLAKVRRFGRPTIAGDYALLSQLNGFAGYAGVTPTVNGISDDIINRINNTGLLGVYNGAALQEIENPYDFTRLNADGDNFDTLWPAGLGFVIPAGGKSPIYMVTRGGLTSCSGNDVTTGERLSRFDLEVGALVAPGREYEIATLHDTDLDTLA